MKTYRTQDNVGQAKYTVSFHDGVKTHKDGSPFFDIQILSSKRQRDRFVKDLESEGYTKA